MQDETNSLLTLENRSKLTMTGVESVDAFSDKCIRLTVSGVKLAIEGEKLKILSFSEGNGNFAASGEIAALRYGRGGKRSIFS